MYGIPPCMYKQCVPYREVRVQTEFLLLYTPVLPWTIVTCTQCIPHSLPCADYTLCIVQVPYREKNAQTGFLLIFTLLFSP